MSERYVAFTAKDYGADAGELSPTLRAGPHHRSHANAGVMPAVLRVPEQPEQNSLQLTSSAADSPAKTLVLQASERDLLASVQDYGTSSIVSLVRSCPRGFSSRTSLACYRATEDEILPPSFQGWQTSGMGGPTGFWTANFSEWPNDAVVCSLSDTLETPRPHLERYTLSARACQGVLRRAAKRGKELPIALAQALQAQQGDGPQKQRRC